MIVISVQKPELDSSIDPRFGRAGWFLVVDPLSKSWEAVQNPAAGQSRGAGIAAAQFVVDRGVEAVVSGRFGPNAARALDAAGIRMFVIDKDHITASKIVDAFNQNALTTFKP
jgi:predicted Fe-Mo cluster-binding NifX family protein